MTKPRGKGLSALNMLQVYALSMIFLIISMPAAFAISIDVNSISVTEVTDKSAEVQWNTDVPGSGQVDYGISSSQLISIPETGSYRTSHQVSLSALSSGTRYYYRMASYDESRTLLSQTNFYEFTTLLSYPSGLKTDGIEYDSANIKWNSVSNADSYNVYINGVKEGSSESTSFSITGLLPESSYDAQVSAVDSLGRESEKSAALSFSTKAEPVEITFVETTAITDTSVVIKWQTDVATESIIKYDTDIVLDKVKSDSTEVKSHTISLTGLSADTRYYYTVGASSSVSDRKTFETLPEGTKLQTEINDVSAGQISANSAVITWTTSQSSSGRVEYSTDNSLSDHVSEAASSLDHSVKLENLLTSTKYYYRVSADGRTSDTLSFNTTGSQQSFIQLDKAVNLTNSVWINVSGTTRKDARVYIFVNGASVAQVKKSANGTKFRYPVHLSSLASNKGITGNNYILVRSWDSAGNSDSRAFYVVVDISPPYLNVVSTVPELTRLNSINISGISEAGATIIFMLDGKTVATHKNIIDANFSQKISLGRTYNHTLQIIASDAAGNKNTYEKKITVDKDAPKFEFENKFQETHFPIYNVKGRTEPGAEVIAVNYGKYTSCEEAAEADGFVDCNRFLDGSKVKVSASLAGMVMGMVRSTTADAAGNFQITVPLTSGNVNGPQDNNLEFFATDSAGNRAKSGLKRIRYSPGCPEWVVSRVDSNPFNIYTSFLSQGNIGGSAIMQVTYLSTGTPDVRSVNIFKDRSDKSSSPLGSIDTEIGSVGSNKLSLEMENDNKYVTLGSPKSTKYSEQKRGIVVYVPVTINQYSGAIEGYPDQLYVYMGMTIAYTLDGNSKTCTIYTTASYDVQKPDLVTKWLSPEMINNTIETLGDMINATEKVIDKVNKANQYTLLACGAMVIWNYLKGFAGSSSEGYKETGKCSEREMEMDKVYWVCDRVLCPYSPPDCTDKLEIQNDEGKWVPYNGKDSTEKDNYEKQLKINQELRNEYDTYISENKNPQIKFDKWLSDKCKTSSASDKCGQYKALNNNFRIADYDNKGSDFYVQQYYVDPKTKTVNDPAFKDFYTDPDGKINVVIQREFDTKISSCIGGTLYSIRSVGSSDNFPTQIVGSTKLSASELECKMGDGFNKPELNAFDPNLVSACYNPECPQFDNTKCFNTAGINPPDDLWSSARCLCLPGLLSHLRNWLKIMFGAKKCLEQALIGETTAGWCERLIAQFVCDLLVQAFRFIMSTVDSSASSGGLVSGTRGSLSSFKENSQQVSKQLSGRYGGVVRSRLGLSSDQLVNKACMFAITGQWEILDGIFEDFVDAVEVAPVASMTADSVSSGYDPFTGRMGIMYSITVGIVAGGETDVTLNLKCDRNQEGGEYCGKELTTIPIPIAFAHMTKDSPPVSQTVVHSDSNAKYWANVAELTLSYRSGEIVKTEQKVVPIRHKSDLSYSCSFDLIGGIQCESNDFGTNSGVVQLYPKGHTDISPRASLFYSNNVVAAKVKIDNSFTGNNFFLRADYPGRNPSAQSIEYRIPGKSVQPNLQGLQTYNIFIDNVGQIIDTGGASQTVSESNKLGPYELEVPGELPIKFENFGSYVSSHISSPDLPMFTVLWKENKESDKTYTSTISFSDGAGETTTGSEIKLDRTVLTTTSSNFKILNLEYLPGDGTHLRGGYVQSIEVKNIKSKTTTQAATPSIIVGTKGGPQQGFFTITEKTYSSSGLRNILLNVLQNPNDGSAGTEPIYYNNGADQKVSLSYQFGTAQTTDKPVIDFLEPDGGYLIVAEPNPIGFNIMHPKNKVTEIEIDTVGQGSLQGKYNCKFKIQVGDDGTFKDNQITPNSDSKCKLTVGSRNIGFKQNNPPFFEFFLDLSGAGIDEGIIPTSSIMIYVKAKGESEWSDQSLSLRSFNIDKPNTDRSLKQEDLFVILGGQDLACTKCIPYSITSATVSTSASAASSQISQSTSTSGQTGTVASPGSGVPSASSTN